MFIVLHVWPIAAKIKTRKLATTTNMVINDLACGLVFLHLIGFFWEYNNISEIFLVLVVFSGLTVNAKCQALLQAINSKETGKKIQKVEFDRLGERSPE